jgi:hypothetical protein
LSSPFVSRSQWGARSPNGSGNSLTGNGKGYALHWEGPEMGSRSHGECDNLMRSIQNYHMDSQGWSDIAYNLAVCEHGYIFEGRGEHKGSGANGTSDANHNYQSICALVGENDPQPSALLDGIADAVAMIRSWGAGSAEKGHRDFVSTACPGNSLYDKLKDGRFSGGSTGGGSEPDDGTLDVDGWLGSGTTRRWQEIMGTPVDGVISVPSMLVEAVQEHLNAKGARNAEGDTLDTDGKGIQSNEDGRYPSGSGTTNTIEALQAYLDVAVDGYFSAPSNTVKALQKRLNTGKF